VRASATALKTASIGASTSHSSMKTYSDATAPEPNGVKRRAAEAALALL
jgi:hypothetical protein